MNYSERIDDLFSSQLKEWELAGTNYSLLSKVRTKRLSLSGFELFVQFNPERMRSSAAKVDSKSIEARPCFLCGKNRPEVQKGIDFADDLTILINPFPIFDRHLTIPSKKHIDQRIGPNFESMLDLAGELKGFVIFYNGPECGASAPDHFHYQAGNRGFLPVEKDFDSGNMAKKIFAEKGLELWHWNDYLRGMMTLKGNFKKDIIFVFNNFYRKFSGLQPEKSEPMLNILAYFKDGDWIVHIIPRKIHRPVQFFEKGEKQILLSPASVDLGGVIILPREEDFIKISENDVKDIFKQVCLSDNEVLSLFS
jgi:hypothetical protein